MIMFKYNFVFKVALVIMGVAVSKIWGGGPRYTADSITGLSGEEKALLVDTFNVLKQDLAKSGERLFILYVFNNIFGTIIEQLYCEHLMKILI